MKSTVPILVLLALISCPLCMAQTPPAVASPADVTAATAPASVADFLATLSSGQSNAPGIEAWPPSPRFLSTLCNSNADCPPGQLCCYPCGIDGCDWICMIPERNRCPFIP